MVKVRTEDVGKVIEKGLKKKEGRIPIEDFAGLMEWLEQVVEIRKKRDLVRNPKGAFESPIVVITNRGTLEGVFLNFREVSKLSELPKEVRTFLLALINVSVCKGKQE